MLHSKLKPSRMVVLYFCLVATFFVLYFSVYTSLMGSPVVAEWWLGSSINKKEMLLSDIKEKKRIVVISGSNSLFGLDTKRIEEDTGIKAFNFGMHAGLDMDFLRFESEKVIRKGDIVIMPLEYSYYYTEKGYSEWFIENVLSWGQDYFSDLELLDAINMVIHTPVSFIAKQASAPKRVVTDNSETLRKMQLDGVYRGYSYKSLNKYGDITPPNESTPLVKGYKTAPEKSAKTLSYTNGSKVSEYTLTKLKEINSYAKKVGARLYVTWPVSMRTRYFNSSNPSSIKDIASIKKALNDAGIKTICDPFSFNLKPDFFYDTHYHLNSAGQKVRSSKLAECIKQEL